MATPAPAPAPAPGPDLELRPPALVRHGGFAAAALLGATALFLLGVAVSLAWDGWAGPGGALGLVAVMTAGLCLYVLRDARAKNGWRVAFGAEEVALTLPPGRLLGGRAPAVAERARYADMAAVLTRYVAYPGASMTAIHLLYGLRMRDGRVVILGEDRALNTNFASRFMARVAAELAARAELAVEDRGMIEASGGLRALFAPAPLAFDTPALAPERQDALWSAAGLSGRLAHAAALGAYLGGR